MDSHDEVKGLDGERLTEPEDAYAHDDEVKLDLKPLGCVPILVMVFVLVGLLGSLFYVGYAAEVERKALISDESKVVVDSRPIVSVIQPYRGKKLPSLTLPASTRAFQDTLIYPRANGYLKSRLVDIGDRVTTGQLLAEIDIPEVQAQLDAAEAKMLVSQANLGQSKVQLELAQVTYNRSVALPESTISKQEIDQQQTSLLSARNAFAGAEGTVKADVAEIDGLKTLMGFSRIMAPFSGVISARNYDVGTLLTPGSTGENTAMFRLVQMDVLRVVIDVPQAYFDQIEIGYGVKLLVRNFPNVTFSGRIARSSDAVDQKTRTVRVEADFSNGDGRLLPGMYGQVVVDLQEKEMPLLVPTSALVFGAAGLRVGVVSGDGSSGRLAFKEITPGRDFGTEVEVLSGLVGDERVVTNPGERLSDGIDVVLAGKKG